jgi:hypothetical protein
MTSTHQALTAAPDFSQQLEQLRAHFFQWKEVNPGANIYVLLDQNRPVAEHDELHGSQLQKREIKRATKAVLRPDLAHDPATLPLLLQLFVAGENGYADEALLGLTLRNAVLRCRSVNGAYVAGWMCSDAGIDTLAAHLAKSGVVFALGEGRRQFVPMFEPYRMALLADDKNAGAFLSQWFGPIKQWMFVDTAGALRVVGPSTEAASDNSPPSLRQEHFAAQARINVARFVVMALERNRVQLVTQPERRIDNAIAQAQAQGLRETEDLIFYALNTFTLSKDWSAHPKAAALIRQTVALKKLLPSD